MPRIRHQQRSTARPKWANGEDGIDFVRCRICGDRRRVISGRHLSKHAIDRDAYIKQYGLSPDELITKGFRMIQSSRPGFQPHGKPDWITAITKVFRREGDVFAGCLQHRHPHLYEQGVWLFGNWNNALRAAGFIPEQARLHTSEDRETIIRYIRKMRQDNVPLYAKYVIRHRPKLHSGALRRFGSWKKALNAAGIETPKYASAFVSRR